MENENKNPEQDPGQKKENPYTPGVNPFTNQQIPPKPPNPAFNPPGEIKPPAIEPQPEAVAVKPAGKFDFKVIFLYILLVAVGGVLAKYAFDFFVPKKPKPETPTLINVNAQTPSRSLIKIVPGKQSAEQSSGEDAKKGDQQLFSIKKKISQTVNPYNLSGIFFSGDKNYCIINDRVVAEGDTVEGAKVTRISTEDVELQLNDKTIRLNLRGR